MSIKSASEINLLEQNYFYDLGDNKSGERHFSGQKDRSLKDRQTVLEQLPRRKIYTSGKHYQPLQDKYERMGLSSDDRPLCSNEAPISPEAMAYLYFFQDYIKEMKKYVKGVYFHGAETYFESEKQIYLEKNININIKIEKIFSEQLQKAKKKIEEEIDGEIDGENSLDVKSMLAMIVRQAFVAIDLAKSEIKKSAFLDAQKYLKDGKITIETAAEKANLTSEEDIALLTKYVIEEGPAEEAMKNGKTGTTGRKVAEQFGITNQEDIKNLRILANNQIKKLGFFKGCALNFKNKFI